MSWGAMMGLGQGLQQVGGMLMDMNKEKMRERLEIEREQRAEQRELAKEKRQLEQFSGSYEIDRDSGLKYRVNKAGHRMADPVRLTAYEIRQHELADKLAELEVKGKEQSVTNQGLEGQIKGFQVRDYDSDRAARLRKEEASIEASLAQAQAARSRAMNAGGSRGQEDSREPHPLEYADTLVKEYKAAFERYGIEDGREQQRIAELAVQGAAAEGISPAEYLLRYLSNRGD